MSLKRALVVDDSKVARATLKKQLEEYNLHVELAESGEAAIELLKTHKVDVIFMDHIMPGMDGLEAVALIKRNPLTATIPVMMYTSKEGEVYVSEARALGAVGVLPKQVHPGVLFGMLVKLGLVRNRRAAATAENAGENDETTAVDSPETDGGAPQPAGFEVSALMSRILEDQHSELRSDIRTSYQRFAEQVANEVYDQLRESHEIANLEYKRDREDRLGWQILSGVLGLVAILLLTLFLQQRSERVAAHAELAAVTGNLVRARPPSTALDQSQVNNSGEALTRSESAYARLLNAIAWTMNESSAIPFNELPFNETRIDQVSGLLWQLTEAEFRGTVRIESHLGEFCLVSDSAGIYQLQDPDAPFTSCSFIGHPLDQSRLLADRETSNFESFRVASPLLGETGIDLDILVRDRADSFPRVAYPENPVTAGDWNRVAGQNHRLEYFLLPALPD